MDIFFRSRQSRSQKPQQAASSNAASVDVPIAPRPSHRIRGFFSFGPPSSQTPLQAGSSIANGVPSPYHPGLEPVHDGRDSAAHDFPSNFASPFHHPPQLTASPVALDAAHMLCPPGPPSIHRVSPSPTTDPGAGQRQHILSISHPPSIPASQLSLIPPIPTMPPPQHSPQLPDGNSYQLRGGGQIIQMIHESKDVTVDGNNNYINYTNAVVTSASNFMEKLLEKTIPGAAFDSSDRDPPPRCHPGTRLAVIARCLEFIANATGKKKLRWVVGQAGAGKSAIMQNVIESPLPSVSERASIFLSINGRNDGTKIIMTLVYQLADRCRPYRQFIEHEITHHPSLLQSSMSVQFKKFLIEPFIDSPLSNTVDRILIIIDGLDECHNLRFQGELLRLIADVCSSSPSSPLVWIIASRPEAHITSFFNQDHVKAVYEREEILVDSNEARSDVERFLRAEMTRIQKEFSLSPGPWSQWPPEQDFWKLASASGGLFAFAQTVVKYIGDPEFGDPITQLKDVLKAIDSLPLVDVPREQHPLALLDTLYARILSKVPERIMPNTRKILLALVLDSQKNHTFQTGGFLALCNWLGMTCDDAYAAIRHLGSVLSAPKRDDAYATKLQSYHKSFIDYLSDSTRSGFSSDTVHEAKQLEVQYAIRILNQAPLGIDCSPMVSSLDAFSGGLIGYLVSVPGAGSDIVLTWPTGEDNNWSDSKTRLEVYKWAFATLVEGIRTRHSGFCTEFYIRVVTSQMRYYSEGHFPYRQLLNSVFENSRRHELIKNGILKRVSIRKLQFAHMTSATALRFRRPSGITTRLSDPWNPSCEHQRAGDWGDGKEEDWKTEFIMTNHTAFGCYFCCERLEQHLKSWKTRSPNHDVTFLYTSAHNLECRTSFAEFQFIDPVDGVSEWTYWITLEIPE